MRSAVLLSVRLSPPRRRTGDVRRHRRRASPSVRALRSLRRLHQPITGRAPCPRRSMGISRVASGRRCLMARRRIVAVARLPSPRPLTNACPAAAQTMSSTRSSPRSSRARAMSTQLDGAAGAGHASAMAAQRYPLMLAARARQLALTRRPQLLVAWWSRLQLCQISPGRWHLTSTMILTTFCALIMCQTAQENACLPTSTGCRPTRSSSQCYPQRSTQSPQTSKQPRQPKASNSARARPTRYRLRRCVARLAGWLHSATMEPRVAHHASSI